MRKTWVLDTSTKGTGATVVPLERTRTAPEGEAKAPVVPAKAKRREQPRPAARAPRRFKIVDVVSRETLADGVRMRATLDVLEHVRSPVDVRISVWDDERATWRPLTLVEHRRLWDAARAAPASGA